MRKSQVQDDRVVALGVAEEIRPFAVGGRVHGVAGLGERIGQLFAQPRLVFDDKQVQSLLLPHWL